MFCCYILLIENGPVTADGTKVLTVEEYDKFIQTIPESKKAIIEINTICGLRYVKLQKLYDNPACYYKERNQITLPEEFQQKVKQRQIKRTIYKLPSTFPDIFKQFVEGHKLPERSSWNSDLERWSQKAGIKPKVGPKTPRKTIESWMLKIGIPEIGIYSRHGHDL